MQTCKTSNGIHLTSYPGWREPNRLLRRTKIGIFALLIGALVVVCSSCGDRAVAVSGSQIVPGMPKTYADGRPGASYRLNATDQGVVLKHGDGPNGSDVLGARDIFVYKSGETYFMNYDGAGSTGWLAALATSTDLVHWSKKGSVLPLGAPGSKDSASASYGTTYFDGKTWHMYYLGTPNVSAAPNLVPGFPYLTLKAKGSSPEGPWTKESDVIPFAPTPDTYYSLTASPGQIANQGSQFLMFFSSTGLEDNIAKRTIGIARTKNLDGSWLPDPLPMLPMSEQIENSAIFYQDSTKTWFMFTNHVAVDPDKKEYTDAIWVYWTQDVEHWNSNNKAVVIDTNNSKWSQKVIGLPSVMVHDGKLAIFYDGQAVDAPTGSDPDLLHMNRDVGLAWLDLPIKTP